jgi:cysteine synthase A
MTEQAQFRGKIYDSAASVVGGTPMVRLSRLVERHGAGAEILGKCEFLNPLFSVKDRIGAAMIAAAERDGTLKPGGRILEPTSGNTGIALAFVAAAKGHHLTLVMPESMSFERRKMLKLLGAELVLTPAEKGMKGAVAEAERLAGEDPGIFMPQQFKNPANPEIHRKTTAEEIWRDSGGRVDGLIAGVGTGGTITGTGQVLKQRNPDFKCFAVEPTESPVLAGGAPSPHRIQGIGAGFVPDILDRGVIDEVLHVSSDEAIDMAKECAKVEGIACGISSGAALTAALKLGKREDWRGKRIAVILPSAAERYLSLPAFKELG